MRKNETSTEHRITKADERLLWEQLNSKLDSLSGSSRKDIETEIQRYIEKNPQKKTQNSPTKIKAKRIVHSGLNDFLAAGDISYREMLSYCSKDEVNSGEVTWANCYQEMMCNLLDSLDDDQIRKCTELIYDFVAPDIKNDSIQNDSNDGRRICNAIAVKLDESRAALSLFSELGLRLQWRKRQAEINHNAIPLSKMPVIAKRTGISLHWMLRLNEEQTVLASKGTTEMAMDWFCFLSEPLQKIIYGSLNAAVHGGDL